MANRRVKLQGSTGAQEGLDPSVVVPDPETMPKDLFDLELLTDHKPGPLDVYRKLSSFDWKTMKLFMDGEDITRFKV